VCERPTIVEDLRCFDYPSCLVTAPAQGTMVTHIQKKHNHGKLIKCHIILFPSHSGSTSPPTLDDEVNATEDAVASGLLSMAPASGEGSSSAAVRENSPGPARERPSRPRIRTTPYDRSPVESESSPSASPSRRNSRIFSLQPPSTESLSQIPSSGRLGSIHSPALATHSPLIQLAFSHPNSQASSRSSSPTSESSAPSTDEMQVDDDEKNILVKASLAVIEL